MTKVETSPEHETSSERLRVDSDTMVLFDLDRTLIDSGRLADLTLLSLEDGFDRQADKESIAAIEKVRAMQHQLVGNSFPYLEALQREMKVDGADWIKGLAQEVIDANRDNQSNIKQSFINQIMLPGSLELIEQVDQMQASWMIMTAGQKVTQLYKLALLQSILDATSASNRSTGQLSYLVTDPDHPQSKAKMIQQSFVPGRAGGEPKFYPELLTKHSTYGAITREISDRHYANVILIDDKPSNLELDPNLDELDFAAVLVQADANPDRPGMSLAELKQLFSV